MAASYISKTHILWFMALICQVMMDKSQGKVTDPHREPSKCEVCKFVAKELEETMTETGKTSDVLHLGHRFDQPKRHIKYTHSELRLLEVLDEVCPKILQYNIHAERQSSRRFAKGTSETMGTLHGLVDKGVKVELGIPYEMWDEPSAAVTKMKQFCDTMVEEHEEAIENWFFKTAQEKPLEEYLCRERVLSKNDHECLDEVWTGKEKVDFTKEAEEEREAEEKEKKEKEKKKKQKEKKQKEKERKRREALKEQGLWKGEEDELEREEEKLARKNEKKRKEKERAKEKERMARLREAFPGESDDEIRKRFGIPRPMDEL